MHINTYIHTYIHTRTHTHTDAGHGKALPLSFSTMLLDAVALRDAREAAARGPGGARVLRTRSVRVEMVELSLVKFLFLYLFLFFYLCIFVLGHVVFEWKWCNCLW